MHSAYIVEVHVAGNNKTYLGLNENCPILLCDINNICGCRTVFLNRFPFLGFLAPEDGTDMLTRNVFTTTRCVKSQKIADLRFS